MTSVGDSALSQKRATTLDQLIHVVEEKAEGLVMPRKNVQLQRSDLSPEYVQKQLGGRSAVNGLF